MERCSVSSSNNIAEGFERGTTLELLTFIYIARGSAGELRSILLLLDRLPDFSDLKSDISNLKSLAESISRSWADSLQNSKIKGQRYLADKTRQTMQIAREREKSLEELRRSQEENITSSRKSEI
jgi:four helix bundle protein